MGFVLLNPLRWLGQNPRRILAPLVAPGMRALDVGCAMGFFSLPLARLVGETGRVVCVDVEPRMLRHLERRARGAGLLTRLELRRCATADLGLRDLAGTIDFTMAFAVVHEAPDQEAFLEQIAAALRGGGRLLLAEPKGHVRATEFSQTLEAARRAGLQQIASPPIARSLTALLEKPRRS
jgi:FkbM family methyltransferase